MPSGFLKLNLNDLAKGTIVAVGAALFTYLAGALNAPGFDWASLDWQYVLKIAVTSFIGYVGKNLLSDESGKVLGCIG